MFSFFKKKSRIEEAKKGDELFSDDELLPIDQLKLNTATLMKMQLLQAKIMSGDENIANKISADAWCLGYIAGIAIISLANSGLNETNDAIIRNEYLYSLIGICFGFDKQDTIFDLLVAVQQEEKDISIIDESSLGYEVGVGDYLEWLENRQGNIGLLSMAVKSTEL